MNIIKSKRIGNTLKRLVLVAIFLFIILIPGFSGNNRNIASVIYYYYFPPTEDENGTYKIDSLDVLLIRILPSFLLKAEIARTDSYNAYNHVFSLGPIINFTKNFYMDAVYGLGINSDNEFSHKIDLNFTQETDTSTISFGVRAHYFVINNYYYYLPSVSAGIYPIPQLRVFCKVFFSSDRYEYITGSVWSEVGWMFTSLFSAYTGFTISYTEGFGYSGILGCTFKFSKSFSLKYFFQYLSNTVEYGEVPEIKTGIANGLIVDVRF